MSGQSYLPFIAPATLDYEKCTPGELCKFFEDRNGVTLSKAELQSIQDHERHLLIDHLRKMDKERSFPRFMQLPPELRLCVYEALLVPELRPTAQEALPVEGEPLKHDTTPSTIHPAILRTSKQIHSEAMPVLYKQNKFHAKLEYCTVEHPFQPTLVPFVVGCSLTITRPAGKSAFCQQIPRRRGRGSLLRRLLGDRTMGMLRMLTYLTVDMTDFITPEKQRSSECILQACFAMRALCLSLTGASKLEELTIKARIRDPQGSSSQRRDFDLACALWPLLYLRTDIVVKFDGISAVTETKLDQSVGIHMTGQEDLCFARQIAQIRRLCSAEVEERGWDQRGWAFYGMEHVETALHTLTRFGIWRISLRNGAVKTRVSDAPLVATSLL